MNPVPQETTLTQLAADLAEIRQQIDQVNQRLDMIYGAVTRLAETKTTPAAPAKPAAPPSPANMLVTPANMFESLRQHALTAGMNIPAELVTRLRSNLPAEEQRNGA